MCGFAGYLGSVGGAAIDHLALLERMASAIAHRGPDDNGTWYDLEAQIGMGHRRLSIVDLSMAGHQPMQAANGRYVLVFNGEIYNHLDLRHELASDALTRWRGHSDTETLLAGFERWGIEETVKRATGMFAFALWDRQTRVLTLGRDRVGEKPLYYGWQGGCFLFGSELKALKRHPAFVGAVDRNALAQYLRYNYVPSPASIYAGIQKLAPGCLLKVSLSDKIPHIVPYWSLSQVVGAGLANPLQISEAQAVTELEHMLKRVVQRQMVADVPVGAFLSGGVDSSLITALMQSQSAQPINTFTIGFTESDYNEAVYAKAVAKHLGTVHTELYVTPEQATSSIPLMATLYDEPFADSSQIPTYLVAKLARQQVIVSLSGDGGDEIFCGYNRYFYTARYWKWISALPVSLRSGIADTITSVTPTTWNRFAAVLPMSSPGDKLHKGADILTSSSLGTLYDNLVSSWTSPSSVVLGTDWSPASIGSATAPPLNALSAAERMMFLDTLTYLPDDILVKLDRASMAVSLESRVPFLDHELLEFAWRMPLRYKLHGRTTKLPLRQILEKYVPTNLTDRPKMGFGVPIGAWLRGPLRDWAEHLLDRKRLLNDGFFNPDPVREKWEEHLSGRRNWSAQLWALLMFQSWQDNR